MKRLKSTLNSSSQMLLTDKKWPNLKENSPMKDVEKSSSSREKYVKVMISHLLLSMKKVLTQFVWKPSPTKKSSLSEEPREETWKESFWLVEDQLSTLLKNWPKLIWDMLMKSTKFLWVNKSTHSLKVLRTQDLAQFWSRVQTSTPLLKLRTESEMDLEPSRTFMMTRLSSLEQVHSRSLVTNIFWHTERVLLERPNLVSKLLLNLYLSFQRYFFP